MDKVNSTDIKRALAKKHEGKSFFMTECKTGPTWDNKHLFKFDGLAIDKSWTSPCITGYEIKISRSDFLQDNKYHCYLPYCNEMYFVVLKGLIDKKEIPSEFGLIYYDPETTCLRTKKKAIYREIEVSADMLMYIIMNRLFSERYPFYSEKADYFKAWVDNKENNRNLGRFVSSKMGQEICSLSERLDALKGQEAAVTQLKEIKEYLRKEHHIYYPDCKDESFAQIIDGVVSNPHSKEIEYIKMDAENILRQIGNMTKEKTNVT